MGEWVVVILTSLGTSIITCVVMEAYHVRRAKEEIGEYDKFTE